MAILTARQAAFAAEYVKDFNGSRAATAAGYSARTAAEQATDLLTRPHVQAEVTRLKDLVAARNRIDTDQIIQELKRIAFGDIRDTVRWGPKGIELFPSEMLTADAAAAIVEVSEHTSEGRGGNHKTVKLKRADKIAALALLAKYDRNFVDRKEVAGKDGGPVQVQQSWIEVMNEDDGRD